MSRHLLRLLADLAWFAVLCVAVPVSLSACLLAFAADWLEDLCDALEAWEP